MPRLKTKANSRIRRRNGFSNIELLITATVLTIITSFGLMGMSRARASIRLSGAAREYASYIEKARIFSIRRHADEASKRATVAINANRTSYNVTMDLDGDGGMDTRTIPLPSDVSFETIETIAFDWRGRTWSTVGGVATPNAQVSVKMKGSSGSVLIGVTGSGDITIDGQVSDNSVPSVTLKVGDLAAGATPTPTPFSVTLPTPDVPPLPVPTPEIELPLPTPTPGSGGGTLPLPTPTPTPTPTSTPTPTPTATPTPTPTPSSCTIATDKSMVVINVDGSTGIQVSHSANTSISISAASSKTSDLGVTPNTAQTVSTGGAATFTIQSKKSTGAYSVTFTSSCGSKVVPVFVLP